MNDAFWQPGWVLPEGFFYVVNELCGERAQSWRTSSWQASSEVANELRTGKRAWLASSELANELMANELRGGEQA